MTGNVTGLQCGVALCLQHVMVDMHWRILLTQLDQLRSSPDPQDQEVYATVLTSMGKWYNERKPEEPEPQGHLVQGSMILTLDALRLHSRAFPGALIVVTLDCRHPRSA